MKRKHLLNDLKLGRTNVCSFALFIAMFLMASSTFGQVQQDKLRIVPTVKDDASTEFLLLTHLTDSARAPSKIPSIYDDLIENVQNGMWVEYQIVSPEGGDFLVVLLAGTARDGGKVNVGVYNAETGFWPETGLGDTLSIPNSGNWATRDSFYFPVKLEAGEPYKMRVNYLSGGSWVCNTGEIFVIEQKGSIDASLSDIKVDGETIEGFDPDVYDYTIALPPYVWIESLEATANDPTSVVTLPESVTPVEGANSGSYTISVKSEAGIVKKYTVKVVSPVIIDDGVSLNMAADVYYSKGINYTETKVNSINNNDYIDYYIYSEYDDNYIVTLSTAMGYDPSDGHLNVSTLGVGDTTWTLNPLYTKYIPTTRDEFGVNTWSDAYAQDIEFVISVKAEVPTLFRIYGITSQGNAADIFSMTFSITLDGIDATLKDLQVDGTTVWGFDPNKTTYSVAMPIGTTSATISAEKNEASAEVSGEGTVDFDGLKAADTISVVSESGFGIDYIVNLFAPTELVFTETDTINLLLADQMFFNSGAKVSNALINYFRDSMYVEYYLYSATDKDLHVVMDVSNGNLDSLYSKLNVSTYKVGEEWVLDDEKTIYTPRVEESQWSIDFATKMKYNISLKAGEPQILRLFSMTSGGGSDIHRLALVNGSTDFVAVESVEASAVKVLSGYRSLTVLSNEAFVGGSVQLYDLSGRLVKSELVNSDRTVIDVDRSGLYIVKLQGANNAVQTVKCIVK